MKHPEPPSSVIEQLKEIFHRNGYTRPPLEKRAANVGYGRFRRGFEFRLIADTSSELRLIRSLLHEAGFKLGKPFQKGNQFRQPVYGRRQLNRFLDLVGERDP